MVCRCWYSGLGSRDCRIARGRPASRGDSRSRAGIRADGSCRVVGGNRLGWEGHSPRSPSALQSQLPWPSAGLGVADRLDEISMPINLARRPNPAIFPWPPQPRGGHLGGGRCCQSSSLPGSSWPSHCSMDRRQRRAQGMAFSPSSSTMRRSTQSSAPTSPARARSRSNRRRPSTPSPMSNPSGGTTGVAVARVCGHHGPRRGPDVCAILHRAASSAPCGGFAQRNDRAGVEPGCLARRLRARVRCVPVPGPDPSGVGTVLRIVGCRSVVRNTHLRARCCRVSALALRSTRSRATRGQLGARASSAVPSH